MEVEHPYYRQDQPELSPRAEDDRPDESVVESGENIETPVRSLHIVMQRCGQLIECIAAARKMDDLASTSGIAKSGELFQRSVFGILRSTKEYPNQLRHMKRDAQEVARFLRTEFGVGMSLGDVQSELQKLGYAEGNASDDLALHETFDRQFLQEQDEQTLREQFFSNNGMLPEEMDDQPSVLDEARSLYKDALLTKRYSQLAEVYLAHARSDYDDAEISDALAGCKSFEQFQQTDGMDSQLGDMRTEIDEALSAARKQTDRQGSSAAVPSRG